MNSVNFYVISNTTVI